MTWMVQLCRALQSLIFLNLEIEFCSFLKCMCSSPGQHSRPDPVGRGVDELAMKM